MVKKLNVKLPHDFEPRDYQKPLFNSFGKNILRNEGDVNRFFYVWHRRCGKDLAALQLTIMASMYRKGTYWHMLPKYNQARKAIWDGMNKEGRAFIDYFPKDMIAQVHKNEMKITLVNGSIWQMQGSDNYNDLIGTNPIGVVFSEYAYSHPMAWQKIAPMLRENGGWAIFETTPHGENHAYDMYHAGENLDNWFTETLTIEDTGIITKEEVEEERASGIPEEMIQQEYYCSWESALVGAYYAEQLRRAEDDGRVTELPCDETKTVDTWWDVGDRDSTAIVFTQQIGQWIHIIDYYENTGQPPSHYIGVINNKGYNYNKHHLPHDADAVRAGTSYYMRYKEGGLMGVTVQPRTNNLNADIDSVRMLFNRVRIDKDKCYQLLQCLKNYTKHYNEERKCYDNHPLHDWTSHGADAFRECLIGICRKRGEDPPRLDTAMPTFNDILPKSTRRIKRI